MISRRLFIAIVMWLCILASPSSQAATINVVGCTQSAVQGALSSAAAGDTLMITVGNCTWTSPITISKGVILQGAGQDLTVITAAGTDLLVINGNGQHVRVTGMGFTGVNSFGLIQIDGFFASLRMDHLKFTNLTQRALIIGYNTWPQSNPAPAIYGLMDHITYTNNVCHPFALHNGKEIISWNRPDFWGTDQAFYLEDSTFTWNVVTTNLSECTVWDQEHGARAVLRHNTITNGTVYGHDTGSTPTARGNRIKEVYSNTFLCNQGGAGFDCGYSAMDFRGGSSLFYDNTIPLCIGTCTSAPAGFENANSTEIWRVTNSSGRSSPWNFKCSAPQLPVASDFYPHCSGSPFPACGVNERSGQTCSIETCAGGCGTCVDNPTQVPNGVTILNSIDGNGPGNYPCRDQIGRGMDSADHTTQTPTPAYWWNNTDPNNANAQLTALNVAVGEGNYIQANRDVYLTVVGFNGTAGVGRGPLSARPGACTPLVGFWATDTNTFYQCDTPNHWTTYYTPFRYPHPFQAPGFPPPPPSGLRAIVH